MTGRDDDIQARTDELRDVIDRDLIMKDPEPETCAMCAVKGNLFTIPPEGDLALCPAHWNRWVTAVLAGAIEPTCSAHLIVHNPPAADWRPDEKDLA